MQSNRTSPETLTRQLRRRHEYTGSPCQEDQQSCKRNPVKDLGHEAMQSAREQHQESLKRMVDHVWEDYQRMKARENEDLERAETSNRVRQSAEYQRSRSTPGRAKCPDFPSTPVRDSTLSSSVGASGYRGLHGLNDRYQEVRKKHHETVKRSARAAPRQSDYQEMTQRRNIDAMVNPRTKNQQLGSRIRQQGQQPRVVKSCKCSSISGTSEDPEEDNSEYEALKEFERYVKSEADRLDAAVKAFEDDVNMMSKRRERLKTIPAPITKESCRPKQPVLRAIEPTRSRQRASRSMESSRSKQSAYQYVKTSRSKQTVFRSMESSRAKNPVPREMEASSWNRQEPPRRCQCAPRQPPPQKPSRNVKQPDSIMELHPFKSRTASGRPWTDAESKSAVQFLRVEEDTAEMTTSTTSCSEISAPNTDDLEGAEQLLMKLDRNLWSKKCPGPCSDDSSPGKVAPPKNMKQISQMISAEDRDVGLALRLARKLPPNKTKLSSRCPKLHSSADESLQQYGDLEEMTPDLAAKIMDAEERGISAVMPPHKMFACLFPEYATEPVYEVGSITTKNGLVVPLRGPQYTQPLSQQDIADLEMMSDAIRPNIVPSSHSSTVDNNGRSLAERVPEKLFWDEKLEMCYDTDSSGSLVDSADIIGWTTLADSPCSPGALRTFGESGEGALVYTLKPQAFTTNIRLRGSVKPSWFPGYYSILPTDSDIKLASSASQVLVTAHKAVSPAIFHLPKKPACRC